MRKLIGSLVIAMVMTGCAYVSSAQPGLSTATGEAWYTKDRYLLFIPLGTDIYYCPEEGQCYTADIN